MGLRGAALCTIALLALPAAGQARGTPPAPPPLPSQAQAPEGCAGATARVTSRTTRRARSALLCLINDVRERAGAPPLRLSGRLGRAALDHARDMTRRRYFDHAGPGGPTLRERLRRVRYPRRSAGENIGFMTFPTPAALIEQWIASRRHYRNMVSRRFRYVGIGLVAQPAPRAVPSGVPSATVTANFGPVR